MPTLNISRTVTEIETINTKFGKGDVVLVSGLSFPRPASAMRAIKSFTATVIDVKATKKSTAHGGGYSIKYVVKGNRYGRVHTVSPKQLKLAGAAAGAAPSAS